jgi:hypothetical protein
VYYGNASGNYTYRVVAGTNTTATIPNLQAGQTNYVVVRAFSNEGVESPPSNEVSYIVPGVMTITPPTTPAGPAVVNFPVAPGHNYSVQASTDLNTWTTIWQTTAVDNVWLQYTDTNAASFTQRFYRLVMQ